MADDPLIERTEGAAAAQSGGREMRAANLFDLRRIIGDVFGVWGVLLVLLGLTESDAEIERAAGVNINRWAGLGMLALSLVFLTWALTRPLGEELCEAAGDAPPSEQHGGRAGENGDRTGGEPGARRIEP
jgi:hypothetical protein